jgi:hypothetical protein
MSSKDVHMKLEERAEASTASQNKSNPEKLKRQRSWDNILQKAHNMNRDIEAQRLQNEPPERTNDSNERLTEPRYPVLCE